jgi:hypothetical protein
VFAAGIAFSGSAAASNHADLFVDDDFESPDQDTNFSSVQNAVDNAGEDDVIVVRSGTYEESITINVSGLTLEAADGVSPTVSPPESNGRTDTITVSANGVTVQGLDVEATGGSTPRGIVLNADDTSALNNNVSHADSVPDKSRTGPLIAVAGGDNVTIEANTATDGPIAYVGGNNNQVDFTNNTVEGELVDEGFFAFGGTDPVFTFTGNDFSAADTGQDADVKFDLSSVTVDGATDASAIVDTTRSDNNGVGVVEVDGDQFTDSETLFIQEGDDINTAIDSADSLAGVNTVQLADGTYDQSVTVDVEGLTLEGPNAGIAGDSDNRGPEAVINLSDDFSDVLTIASSDVEVNGLSFKFGERAIYDTAGDNLITNNRFELSNAPTSNEYAIRIEGDADGTNVTSNAFVNITSNDGTEGDNVNGVVVRDPDGTTISSNTFDSVDTAVNIGDDSPTAGEVVVNGNEFEDIRQFGAVLVNNNDASLDVDVTNNNISSSDIGVLVFNANSGITTNIENNDFDDNPVHVQDGEGVLDLSDALGNNSFSPVVTAEDSGGNLATDSIYGEIQPAVDDASSGDIVDASAGTYNESVKVSTQNVTLVGPNAGTPGYENRQSTEAVIEQGVVISADSVTLDGFEVTNNGGNGIKVANAPSNVVITNNRVVDVAGGTAGDQKAFANGINLQFNDAFKKTSSGIKITNNEIHNITTEDMDVGSNDVIGIQLLPRGNDVEDLRIADNVISGIEPGDAKDVDWSRAEARGISVDTQFVDEANGDTRGDLGQPKNLTIEENEIHNLTSEYSRAITLFEDKGGSASNPDTPIGPVNFTIRFNTIDNLTSEDPAGSVDAQSTALFIGGYGNLGDGHQFVSNNIEEGAVSRLLYGQVSPPESADLLNAGENWWGNDDGPRASSSSGTVGQVATAPFLTVPYQQLESTDDGTPRQFATELELTGGVNTIAFPAPSERTLNESLDLDNVDNVLVYDNTESSWEPAGNPTPDALDVYVVIVEEGETASLVMEFDNDFDADDTQLSTAEVSGGWNLVSPSQAADTADGAYATRNAEIGLTSENPFQSPHRQPFDADNAEFSPYRGYWTFVDEDDGPSTVGSSNFEGLTLLDYLENVNLPPEDE